MLNQFGYIVSSRDDIDCEDEIKKSANLTKYKHKIKIVKFNSNISSTIVRNDIQTKHKSDYIHKDVLEYIQTTQCFGCDNLSDPRE